MRARSLSDIPTLGACAVGPPATGATGPWRFAAAQKTMKSRRMPPSYRYASLRDSGTILRRRNENRAGDASPARSMQALRDAWTQARAYQMWMRCSGGRYREPDVTLNALYHWSKLRTTFGRT